VVSEDANRTKLRRAFDAHYDAVSRYCHRRLPLQVANDAAAEVFAVAWRKIDDMPVGDAVLPWLYAVARYEVSSARRSQRRWRNLRAKLDGQARGFEDGPAAVVVRNVEHEELLAALGTLRPADQEVLRLRVYEELPHADLAAVLGCSVEAAKKRSARALRRLRRAAGIDQPRATGSSASAGEEGSRP
jgi:RNA polymerase sigma factor (sigma-70 family)